jgi:hypothetical protein
MLSDVLAPEFPLRVDFASRVDHVTVPFVASELGNVEVEFSLRLGKPP